MEAALDVDLVLKEARQTCTDEARSTKKVKIRDKDDNHDTNTGNEQPITENQ